MKRVEWRKRDRRFKGDVLKFVISWTFVFYSHRPRLRNRERVLAFKVSE